MWPYLLDFMLWEERHNESWQILMKVLDELAVMFRQLGGKFDNVEIRHSEDTGYYCYTLDKDKNSLISCPASLLVDIEDVHINADGLFIAHPEKYGNKMAFLGKYFAFHFDKSAVRHFSEKKRQIDSLPGEDLAIIARIAPPELYDLKKYKDLEYEKKRIIDCHNIVHRGKKVLMPFVSFVNFNKHGKAFEVSNDKISISGKFAGEVFAKYNDADVLKLASGYDFITDTKYIYSVPLSYTMANGKKLVINRNTHDAMPLGDGRWKPQIKNQQDAVTLSWFPLYQEGAPLYPAIIARLVANETGMPAENILMNIFKLNLHALVQAAFQLRESDNEFSRFLGFAAQRQLETIAEAR